MGIGKIEAAGSGMGGQPTGVRQIDHVSRNIEKKISNVQRQMQGLSSKEEFSADEKVKKRQELRQEMSKLNTQLRQRQTMTEQEKKRETLVLEAEQEKQNGSAAALSQETGGRAEETKGSEGSKAVDSGKSAADSEKKEANSGKSAAASQALVTSGVSMEQVETQGKVIAKIDRGIAILKSEIRQDEARGEDTRRKEEELERAEKRAERAAQFREAVIKEARQELKAAERTDQKGNAAARSEEETGGRVIIKAANLSKEQNRENQSLFYGAADIFHGK